VFSRTVCSRGRAHEVSCKQKHGGPLLRRACVPQTVQNAKPSEGRIRSWLHAMAFTDEKEDAMQESIRDYGGASASAACDLFVQPSSERLAFPAASEDSVQTSVMTSDLIAHQRTGFFELSPESP